jgi:hypothetical protein
MDHHDLKGSWCEVPMRADDRQLARAPATSLPGRKTQLIAPIDQDGEVRWFGVRLAESTSSEPNGCAIPTEFRRNALKSPIPSSPAMHANSERARPRQSEGMETAQLIVGASRGPDGCANPTKYQIPGSRRYEVLFPGRNQNRVTTAGLYSWWSRRQAPPRGSKPLGESKGNLFQQELLEDGSRAAPLRRPNRSSPQGCSHETRCFVRDQDPP